MKRIPLSQGLFALVDNKDYDDLMQFKWFAKKEHGIFYAARTLSVKGKKKTLRMHSFLLKLEKGQEGDHRNHEGLDNRRMNLRVCTHSQNSKNRKKTVGTSSRFKGVYWVKRLRKWSCRIGTDGKHNLGLFADETEAARVYDMKAKELFGEFAQLNFPEAQ